MRVLQLLSTTGFHGAEAMSVELTRQLHRLGVEVDVAVFDHGGKGDMGILDAVRDCSAATHRLPCSGPLDRQTIRAVRRLLKDRRIDIVHSHKYKTTFYAMLSRIGRPTGLVTTYHNWLTDTPALRAYAALDKAVARFNDMAVAVSTPIATELARHVPSARMTQIDNGIDTAIYRRQMPKEAARQALGVPADRKTIGFVGRLSVEKGLPHLLHALRELPPDITTVIVGDGDQRASLEALVASLGLADRVRMLGSRRDTPLIYSALDLFVLPSTVEAFPMVLLEAMACGCPVVATRVGEVERIVDEGVTGHVVEAGRSDRLSAAIASLLNRDDGLDGIAEAARQRVEQLYSSRTMARRYLEAYERSLRGAPQPSPGRR